MTNDGISSQPDKGTPRTRSDLAGLSNQYTWDAVVLDRVASIDEGLSGDQGWFSHRQSSFSGDRRAFHHQQILLEREAVLTDD